MLTNPHKMLICLHTQTKMHHEVISTFWFPLVINEKRNIALSFPEAVSRGLTEKHSEGAMSLWVFKRFVFIWGTVDAKFNPLNTVKSKRSSVKLGIVTVSARQVCFLSVLQSPRWHISFLISYHSDKHRSRAHTRSRTAGSLWWADESILPALFLALCSRTQRVFSTIWYICSTTLPWQTHTRTDTR